jgi:hypothetical protein
VQYRAGVTLGTSGGVTPSRSSTGTDYDTFFDPDGSVVVSGTTGPIDIHSWRIGQRAEIIRAGGVAIDTGYRLRVDISDFGVGHKTIVKNGVVIAATDVTSPEHTSSQMHEVFFGVRLDGLSLQISPVTVGRLLIQLPEKYPGVDLVYISTGAAGAASYTVTRARISASVHAFYTWSYSASASLKRSIIGGQLRVRL